MVVLLLAVGAAGTAAVAAVVRRRQAGPEDPLAKAYRGKHKDKAADFVVHRNDEDQNHVGKHLLGKLQHGGHKDIISVDKFSKRKLVDACKQVAGPNAEPKERQQAKLRKDIESLKQENEDLTIKLRNSVARMEEVDKETAALDAQLRAVKKSLCGSKERAHVALEAANKSVQVAAQMMAAAKADLDKCC